MDILNEHHWEVFIGIEVLLLLSLVLFGISRYIFSRRSLSLVFICLFIVLLFAEVLLGWYVYTKTGEISAFHIVLIVFILYACTFGIADAMKIDRWMREKAGQLRGVDLLTGKDRQLMKRNKDSKYIARKYRITSMIHLVVFVIGQSILWSIGTDSMEEVKSYLTDWSWLSERKAENSPYLTDQFYSIGVIWGIVFVVDFVYSWSYTVFPKK